MRITKRIEQYITDTIKTKLEQTKYAEDKKWAEDFQKDYRKICDDLDKSAVEAVYTLYKNAHLPDGISFNSKQKQDNVTIYYRGADTFIFSDEAQERLRWAKRMKEEATAIANDIIIEMELGGDKAKLEELLSRVGE